MTTEEQIAELEKPLDIVLSRKHHDVTLALAQVCEIRALRLMLRDEIREAAWRLAPTGQPVKVAQFLGRRHNSATTDETAHEWQPGGDGEICLGCGLTRPLASRKAPLEDKP